MGKIVSTAAKPMPKRRLKHYSARESVKQLPPPPNSGMDLYVKYIRDRYGIAVSMNGTRYCEKQELDSDWIDTQEVFEKFGARSLESVPDGI